LKRFSQPIVWFSTEELKETQQKQTCVRNKIYHNIKYEQKKLQPGVVASYNLGPGNKMGLLTNKFRLNKASDSVPTDITTLFSKTFQNLRTWNSRVFQAKKSIFQDFPKGIQNEDNGVVWGSCDHLMSLEIVPFDTAHMISISLPE